MLFMAKTASKDPERLITIGTITSRYVFFEVIDKIVTDPKVGKAFPSRTMVYDRQTHDIFRPIIQNADYITREEYRFRKVSLNKDIACLQVLPAYKLIEAYEKNELKGKLKEIAAKLDEDSNPVIMVMREKQ